jgi:uncharacterized membrane protein (DUF485 family)
MHLPDSLHFDDPWHDEPASGLREGPGEQAAPPPADVPDGPPVPPALPRRNDHPAGPPDSREAAYLAMHAGADFQEVRRRHRRFVLPAATAFLGCYLGYLALAVTGPGLMSVRPGDGPVTVALLAGAGQFLLVALGTWAYVRHARLRRDPAALELRWHAQQLTRSVAARAGGGPR